MHLRATARRVKETKTRNKAQGGGVGRDIVYLEDYSYKLSSKLFQSLVNVFAFWLFAALSEDKIIILNMQQYGITWS